MMSVNRTFYFNAHPIRKVITTLLFATGLLAFLGGCFPGVYKLDIPQGNVLEEEKIDQLKIGMSKRQVRYVLGTPLLVDSFDQDRWDYYYSYKYYRSKETESSFYEARLVLLFEKGLLATIDKNIPKADEAIEVAEESKKEEVVVPEPTE